MAKRKFNHPLDKALFEAFGINYINHKSYAYIVIQKHVQVEIDKAIKETEKQCTMILNAQNRRRRPAIQPLHQDER